MSYIIKKKAENYNFSKIPLPIIFLENMHPGELGYINKEK